MEIKTIINEARRFNAEIVDTDKGFVFVFESDDRAAEYIRCLRRQLAPGKALGPVDRQDNEVFVRF